MKIRFQMGLTLAEMLVVLAILTIVGILLLNIFISTLRSNNKTQVVSTIKQNGQSVLETMDKTIRNADRVVCVSNDGKSLVVVQNGIFTRYRFIDRLPVANPTKNGFIQQETFNLPSSPPPGADKDLYIGNFENTVCSDPSVNAQVLTDTNTKTGVSIECIDVDSNGNCSTPIFKKDSSAGFKDQVTIKFEVVPGVLVPQAVRGQIDPVTFQTTISLR